MYEKLTYTHKHAHTSARCCGLLTLISAALARTLSSVSTTSVSLGDDQQRRQECLRREEREHSFFQSAFLPSCPPSHDPSIFSCCTAGSSIAALASCCYTAEEAELPLWTCGCVYVCVCLCGDRCIQAECTNVRMGRERGMSQSEGRRVGLSIHRKIYFLLSSPLPSCLFSSLFFSPPTIVLLL